MLQMVEGSPLLMEKDDEIADYFFDIYRLVTMIVSMICMLTMDMVT